MHRSFFSGRVVLFEKEDFNIREDAATVELLAGAGSFASVDTGYLTLAYQSYQQFFLGPGIIECQPHFGGRFQTMQICKYVWRGFGGICLKKNPTCIFFVLVPYNNPRVGSLTMQDNGSTFKWSQRLGGSVIFRCEYFPPVLWLHYTPGRLTAGSYTSSI